MTIELQPSNHHTHCFSPQETEPTHMEEGLERKQNHIKMEFEQNRNGTGPADTKTLDLSQNIVCVILIYNSIPFLVFIHSVALHFHQETAPPPYLWGWTQWVWNC